MKYSLVFLLWAATSSAQMPDTITGYKQKISGEEISYYSPLHQFANRALLTRVNGEMPIAWEAPVYSGNSTLVSYELLIGHSSGTSTAERHFDVALNDQPLFTISTKMKMKGFFRSGGDGLRNSHWSFEQEDYDVNGDAFGKLTITVPAELVKSEAHFRINGKNENSRDWLMVFMYKPGLKGIAEPTNLVTLAEKKRQLNLFIDNPWPGITNARFITKGGTFTATLTKGYNSLQFPAYTPDFTGTDTIHCNFNGKYSLLLPVNLRPVRDFVFTIIHHSHNDIGYSHLQTEVEEIQNRNIRAAIRWISQYKGSGEKPVWHIESLWAVENFLRHASKEEENAFVKAVKSGLLVLSANYANILTGLGQPEELNWVLEYAGQLEKKYGFDIKNGMITDIPGISRSGLMSYVNNHIPYLSLGPNYVESHPDHGDRVGGVIKEQGDQLFYWKPSRSAKEKLLVWTAGKGYSFFHGISDSEKQSRWEKRISDYCNELVEKKYPFDLVQLRYTKNADNGPVDTNLTVFVENWNRQYLYPQLRIGSVDQLFAEAEKKYGRQLPVFTGEISPYWEDGAYSTASEEMQVRQLSRQTIELEKFAGARGKLQSIRPVLYLLHKNIVLFQEHTWGAWCSISDPDIFFSTEQWRIKKQFADSAQYYYERLSADLGFTYRDIYQKPANAIVVNDYLVDPGNGGLSQLWVNEKNLAENTNYKLFEPVYKLGLNPGSIFQPAEVMIKEMENTPLVKQTQVSATLPNLPAFMITYTLFKNEGRLLVHYRFDKRKERDKESLHIAFPFSLVQPALEYGSLWNKLRYPQDQLAGSNKEFVCVEKEISLISANLKATLSSPLLALWEIGDMIDETRVNGAKIWKRENQPTSSLFLYVLNNYWHTNYKADQEGILEFDIQLRFSRPNEQ